MTYIDDYVNRVNNSGGTIAGSFEGNTKNTILNNFANSPYYSEISLEDNQGSVSNNVGVRIVKTNKSNKREILFKPDTSFSIGDIAIVGSDKWILTDFLPDNIFPKAIAELCNTTIKWEDNTSLIQEFSCIVNSKTQSIDEDKYFLLPEGSILVVCQYNETTKTIQRDQRFIFGEKAFKVTGIDNISKIINNVGLIEIMMKEDTINTNDDILNRIADNSHLNNSSGGGSMPW